MKLCYMNKRPPHTSVDQLLKIAEQLEINGFDFCVRPGYPVEPEQAKDRLPAVAQQLDGAGYRIRMVSGTGEMIDPDDPLTQQVIAACGQAGIKIFKIGYFWPNETPYWQHMDMIRRRLTQFGELGERHNVRICMHPHFGCMVNSVAAMMHLLRDLDPRWIGAYLDSAHLTLAGEPLPMAIDAVGEFLAAIALKDVSFRMDHGRITAKPCFPPIGQGMLDWQAIVKTLKNTTLDGPLVVGCEFVSNTPEEQVEDARQQIKILRQLAKG